MKQIKMVIFCVGIAHPLYNKEVLAEVESRCGWNRESFYGKTVEKVYWPKNPKGIFRFDKEGNLLGYETVPAHYKYHEGFCEIVGEKQ